MTYPTTLYRLYDAEGRLLYVGCSINWMSRLMHHKVVKAREWWTDIARAELTRYDSRTEAMEAEFAAIRDEDPLHNGQVPVRLLTDDDLTAQRRIRARKAGEAA